MMRVVHGISVALLGLSLQIRVWLGLILHFGAIYCAWDLSGWFAALLTLIFPVIGEIYWVYTLWQLTGHFWSVLAIGCALYIGLWIVLSVLIGVASATEPGRQ